MADKNEKGAAPITTQKEFAEADIRNVAADVIASYETNEFELSTTLVAIEFKKGGEKPASKDGVIEYYPDRYEGIFVFVGGELTETLTDSEAHQLVEGKRYKLTGRIGSVAKSYTSKSGSSYAKSEPYLRILKKVPLN